jgi:Mor family transcriptional regulator
LLNKRRLTQPLQPGKTTIGYTEELLAWVRAQPPEKVLSGSTERVKELIDPLGLESTIKLIHAYGGGAIYIPKAKHAFSGLIKSAIRNEFTGSNHKELARKFDCSISIVYKALSKSS